MPAEEFRGVKPRLVEGKPESSVLAKIWRDKARRLSEAPVGTAAYTALNLAVSLIPSASFFIDDAVIARVAQKIDSKFQLMYDDEGSVTHESKAHLVNKLFEKVESGDVRQAEEANEVLQAFKAHASRQAKVLGKKYSSPLSEGQVAQRIARMKASSNRLESIKKVQKNRFALQKLWHLNRVLRDFSSGKQSVHPQSQHFGKLKFNQQEVLERLAHEKLPSFPRKKFTISKK